MLRTHYPEAIAATDTLIELRDIFTNEDRSLHVELFAKIFSFYCSYSFTTDWIVIRFAVEYQSRWYQNREMRYLGHTLSCSASFFDAATKRFKVPETLAAFFGRHQKQLIGIRGGFVVLELPTITLPEAQRAQIETFTFCDGYAILCDLAAIPKPAFRVEELEVWKRVQRHLIIEQRLY